MFNPDIAMGNLAEVVEYFGDINDRATTAAHRADEILTAIKQYVPGTDVPYNNPYDAEFVALFNEASAITVDDATKPDPVTLDTVSTDVLVDTVPEPTIDETLPAQPVPPSLGAVPTPPDLTMTYNETYYDSVLLEKLKESFYNELVNGSTGLTPEVEAAIYARESERDSLELERTRDKVSNVWAECGLSLPDGVLVSALNEVEIAYQNKYSDKSRDVRIETFKRADDNAKFVKDISVRLETLLMDYWGKYWSRQLESATKVIEYSTAIYEMLIKYNSLFQEQYKAEVQGYAETIKGITALLDSKVRKFAEQVKYVLGKADIDSRSVGLDMDLQRVKMQKGQTDAQIYDVETRANAVKAETFTKIIGEKVAILGQQIQVLTNAFQNLSHIAATFSAGAMSALNANTSLASHGTMSASSDDKYSYSEEHIYNES